MTKILSTQTVRMKNGVFVNDRRDVKTIANTEEFVVGDLSGPSATRKLISIISSQSADRSLGLDFRETHKVYPNGAVPFACALDFYKEKGRKFHVVDGGHERSLPHVLNPLDVASDFTEDSQLTDVVWKYRDEIEAGQITGKFMEVLLNRMPCEEGVYDTLNWCLFEVLDNVFQHSQAAAGFVMMQLHRDKKLCVISVSDSGIGIHRAMAAGVKDGRISGSSIRKADQAIALAVKQGVTSKGNQNQGNGLFGLSRSVETNGGLLTIHSGKGTWSFQEDHVAKSESHAYRPLLDLGDNHATTVDWQMDCRRKVSIGEVLGSKFRSSDLVDSIETIEGYHELDAAELESSIGSRKRGMEIRTRILNYLNAGVPQIVLNMKNLETVSSSFADEVLGRLAAQLGPAEYGKRIAIVGASITNRQIIARAIELRLETEGIDP